MKIDVFNQYVDRITDLFGVTKDGFFSKSKQKELVDARYLLYYLCYKRPMNIKYIQKYMNDNGYETKHTTILYGIRTIERRVKDDADYLQVFKEIQKAVFI